MKKVTEQAWAIYDKILNVLVIFATFLVIFDTVIVSIDVLMRSAFGTTWKGFFEIAEYSLLWMAFLGAAWLMRINGHVRVDLILSRMKPKPKVMINIISSIICALVFMVIIWYSAKITLHDYQVGFNLSSLLTPPKWPVEMIIPIGSFLLLIQLLRNIYEYLKNWISLSKGEQVELGSTSGGTF